MTATSGSINSSRANDRKGFGTNSDAQRQDGDVSRACERDGARGLARYDCEKRIRSTHMNKVPAWTVEWLFDLRDYFRRRPLTPR
jgi:hypothetical protein